MRRSVAIPKNPALSLVTDRDAPDARLEEALINHLLGDFIVTATRESDPQPPDENVAMVIYDQGREGPHGAAFLERSWRLDRGIRRILLTAHADAESAISSINRPFIDHYLVRPWEPAEERLFPVVDDQVAEWRASVQHPYMRVRGVMAVRPVRIREDESVLRAAEIVALSGVLDLMVVREDGSFAGVLSVGDILRAAMPDVDEVMHEGGSLDLAFHLFLQHGSDLATRSIAPLIIREPIIVDPDDHVAKVATVLLERGIGRLPVLQDGRLVGTVSRADICQAIVGAL